MQVEKFAGREGGKRFARAPAQLTTASSREASVKFTIE